MMQWEKGSLFRGKGGHEGLRPHEPRVSNDYRGESISTAIKGVSLNSFKGKKQAQARRKKTAQDYLP